eukprot:2375712-Prymnesium_polylepis.1
MRCARAARCHLYRSPVHVWHSPQHPCCCNPIAQSGPAARHRAPRCSRGCRRVGTRTSGRQ